MGSISNKIGAKAAIDIGSNTILLTVVDHEGKVLFDQPRIVSLGKGLGDSGVFLQDRMDAAEQALEVFLQIAASFDVQPQDIFVVATSAARRATNARQWFHTLTEKYGIMPRIISGNKEAELTWRGGISGINVNAGTSMLIDLGGGSTEVIHGTSSRIASRLSLETGTVRLTETFNLDHAHVPPAQLQVTRTRLKELFSQVPVHDKPKQIVGVAGTVTTFAAMKLGLVCYDANQVHGSTLTLAELENAVDQFASLTPDARRKRCSISPQRAPYLLAGALILTGLMRHTDHSELIVSNRGLRFGLL